MSDLETASTADLVISTFDQGLPTFDPSLANRVRKMPKAGVGPPASASTDGCSFIRIPF